MDQNDIIQRVEKITILPTFPSLVADIVSLIDDPMSSASDVARHMDPSMSSEVLRIANTAYFGTNNFRKVVTLERAIAVIGYQHLTAVILQMPFLSLLQGGEGAFDREGFIKHAMMVGILAKSISQQTRQMDCNEAYISGNLHDIGKIILHQHFQDVAKEIDLLVSSGSLTREEAERQVIGMDHGVIGGLLLDVWNIPSAIADGVRFHHSPKAAEAHSETVMATALGNEFAKRINSDTDLIEFDDFLLKHRDLSNFLKDHDTEISASEELQFFSSVYNSLKSAKSFFDQATREDHDTSTGS
jgi:putative nucleotidyltransferase with HDIG domain